MLKIKSNIGEYLGVIVKIKQYGEAMAKIKPIALNKIFYT